MRHYGSLDHDSRRARLDREIVRSLLPFVWSYKGRALVALLLLVAAKGANVTVPLVLREIVDALDASRGVALALPLGLLLAYGALRLGANLFRELQTVVFSRVRFGIMRHVSLRLMRHLHALSLRFHLNRKTGALTRDIDRGTSSISTLLNYLLFNIVPTILEVGMVSVILLTEYDWRYAAITLVTLVFYAVFTISVTGWRMKFRVEANALDSKASSRAIDSLINYETVKYFNNEDFEIARYDRSLSEWEDTSTRVQSSLSLLNAGQGALIAIGVTSTMVLAANQVATGELTIGDLVAVNAFLIQVFLPLGFLGTVYSILKNATSDMERMFELLEEEPEIEDRPDAAPLRVDRAEVVFDRVDFGYDPERRILHDLSFRVPPGARLAVVGPSGAGKSTLARLLYRFYDVDGGAIRIDGQDLREVTQQSLRKHIGIVPQDTVLFNESIRYNIAYGRLDATEEEVEEAARMAHLAGFIEQLPDGYETLVGERGLKLSGGEKQRVAIARAILKRPEILIFDEATSSLDSASEQAILRAMREVSQRRTTLTIAHRLSTIVDADRILVMEAGRVVEQGTHDELIASQGAYARLWALQQQEREESDEAAE